MNSVNVSIGLFFVFALGLPIWAMDNNPFPRDRVHGCSGECYEEWKAENGGVVQVAAAQQAARAEASPAELGKEKYLGCVACHGAGGEGGVGPQLSGQAAGELAEKLTRYKQGETLGAQSNLMWGQAAMLSDQDIENLAAYIETL